MFFFSVPAQGSSSQYSTYQQGQSQPYSSYRTPQTASSAQQQRPYGYGEVRLELIKRDCHFASQTHLYPPSLH